ncbi:hypothetical protein WJX74_006768 [Apatococcus lobatus]|uniref:Uncharacterized protein n=2 Tax=Apatococcus TaxID=904362 RepID=A0AAW1SS97_9CHLO
MPCSQLKLYRLLQQLTSFSRARYYVYKPQRKAWTAYDDSLTQAPVLTKCFTSLIGFTFGDTFAQWSDRARKHDLLRTARFAAYGFCVHATSCHLIYNLLDQSISPEAPTSARAVMTKLFFDQCIFAPISIMIFYAVLKTLEGRPKHIRATVRDKLWPTLKTSYVIWPIANLINFLFIPSRLRVLYLNVLQMAWNVVLCRIASAEKPALEKRRSSDLGSKSRTQRPKKQTLSQYLQSMRKPGRHKAEILPLNAGSRPATISHSKAITPPMQAV